MNLEMEQKLAVCVVGNFKYLYKYFQNLKRLKGKGKYLGEILVITSIWCPTLLLKSTYGNDVTILRFKKIKFSKSANKDMNTNFSNGQPNEIKKSFQWHKINLFDTSLKSGDIFFI